MATTELLSETALEQIASGLSELLPLYIEADKIESEMELAETFPLWYLSYDDITNADTFKEAIINTGRWHSQIRQLGRTIATSESISLGNSWQVRQFFFGDYAQKIDETIDIIDQNFSDEFTVRLFESPAYGITGFWVMASDGEHFVVLARTLQGLNLDVGEIYQANDFLGILRVTEPAFGIET